MLSGMSQSIHESRRRPPPLRRYSITPSLFRAGRMNSDRSILSEASSSRSVLAMTILESFPYAGTRILPAEGARRSIYSLTRMIKRFETRSGQEPQESLGNAHFPQPVRVMAASDRSSTPLRKHSRKSGLELPMTGARTRTAGTDLAEDRRPDRQEPCVGCLGWGCRCRSSGRFCGNEGAPAIGTVSWLHLQREGLAPLVQRVELAIDHCNLACMLDPDFPVRRFGNAPETAPVDDEPLIDARRPWPLDFLGPDAIRLDQPVDVLRAKPLGVIDVELAALLALGFLPVNLLSARLDDVQVKVGIRVPDQGELGVADLDRDSTDELASLAKVGQAKAIAFTGPRIVVGEPTAGAWLAAPNQGHGGWLQRRRDQLQEGLVGRWKQVVRRIRHGQRRVHPPGQGQAFRNALGRPGEPAVEVDRPPQGGREIPESQCQEQEAVQGHRPRPAPQSRGAPELRPEKRSPVLRILDQGRRGLVRRNGRGTTRRSVDGYRGLARGVRRLPF